MPSWGAARPTPWARSITSTIRSASRWTSSSTSPTGEAAFRRAGSGYWRTSRSAAARQARRSSAVGPSWPSVSGSVAPSGCTCCSDIVRGCYRRIALAERRQEGAVHGRSGDRDAAEVEVEGGAGIVRDGAAEAEIGRRPHGGVDAHAGHHAHHHQLVCAGGAQARLEVGLAEAV